MIYQITRKGIKMYQRSKVISVALLGIWCFSLLTDISQAATLLKEMRKITPEELQKVEAAMPTKATVTPKQPRKLLVFGLCEGFVHNSIPVGIKTFEIMGRKTGAFETFVSDDMAMFDPNNLNQFDAVLFENTTSLKFKDPRRRKALMDFVKGGKGVIGIHAATDSFYNWPEAAEMMGGLFDGHPWNAGGTWAVKLDEPSHPLNKAFGGKEFLINDEIYQFKAPYSRDKLRVLLSIEMRNERNLKVTGMHRKDNDYAIAWIRNFGNGRVFYCSLGHNSSIYWNKAVLQHYLAGVQFALGDLLADTTPSGLSLEVLEKPLTVIAAYEYGQSRKPLTELADFVRNAYNRPQDLKRIEKRLLKFLRSDATLASKQFICRQLSIIGTEEAVPTLAAMLTNTATVDMARYALERIPGPAVDKALRDALGKTNGKVKVGIINSLGERGDSKAVGALGKLVYDSDRDVAGAAAGALGRISGKRAAARLKTMLKKASGKWRVVLADAYLMCADKFLDEDDTKSALDIYKQLYVSDEPVLIRIAALRGMVIATPPDKAAPIVVDVLKGNEPAMRTVAIRLVNEIPGTKIVEAAAAELPNLPAMQQVQLLSALADRGDRAALRAAVMATRSEDEPVRIAALGALAKLGDDSSVMLLAQAAAAGAAEQEAARESLYRLPGLKIDEVILASLVRADPKVKVELIRSIGQRRMYTAAETLLRTAESADTGVRLESVKALKVIANEKHLPALVVLLINAKSEAERKEAERCVVAVAHKTGDSNRRSEAILAAIPSVKDVKARCSLLSVLAKIGADPALGVLREALEDDNAEVQIAAIRALSDWPSDKPTDALLKIARSSDDERQRILALRGFIRLIGLDSDRRSEETIKMYRQAMDLASNASEKKMVLSGLANVKSFDALYMASNYLEDNALQQEAGAAMIKIAEFTRNTHPQQTKILLKMLIQASKSDSLREQAQEMIDEIE